MQSGAARQPFNDDVRHSHFERDAAERADIAVAVAHLTARAVMAVAGPLFWTALVVGFVAGVRGVGF
ncbi:MAG TPA: hypothetical protein VMS01_15745 [Stellaceae bacterium]|nr:hypothetical protein [Stellaceae bacterium]